MVADAPGDNERQSFARRAKLRLPMGNTIDLSEREDSGTTSKFPSISVGEPGARSGNQSGTQLGSRSWPAGEDALAFWESPDSVDSGGELLSWAGSMLILRRLGEFLSLVPCRAGVGNGQ